MPAELVPANSSAWRQDGLPIERVEARFAGTVGIIDEDASTVTLDSEGVAVVRYHVFDVAGKVNKRTGDTMRKIVFDVSEARVLHDATRAQRLLIDLGFEDTGAPIINTTATEQPYDTATEQPYGALQPPGITRDGEVIDLDDPGNGWIPDYEDVGA